MDRGNVLSSNNESHAEACGRNLWLERLLWHGCFYNRCPVFHASSQKTMRADQGDVVDVFHGLDTSFECIACDEENTVVTSNRGYDEMCFARQPFCTVPKTRSGLIACELCASQLPAGSQRKADHFCYDCIVNYFCSDCKPKHDVLFGDMHRFREIDESEELAVADETGACIPAVLCQRHKSACDHWCYNCDTAKCNKCALKCLESMHRIRRVEEFDLAGWKDQLRNSTQKLQKLGIDAIQVATALNLQHTAAVQKLKQVKTRLANAMHTAYDVAEQALNQSFKESSSWISNLCNYIDSAVDCSQLLTHRLLPSHCVLLQRAQSAVDFLLQRAESVMAREEGAMARLRSEVPDDDLEDVVNRCLGLPVLDSGLNTSVTLSSEPTACTVPQNHDWRGIAVTADEHILVAAGNIGMVELDARGIIVNMWHPTPANARGPNCSDECEMFALNVAEEVVAVDCLEDNRAVVGLKFAHAVILLVPGNPQREVKWQEQTRFGLGEAAPFAIAAKKNHLVVALGTVIGDAQQVLPGKHVVAFEMNTKHKIAAVEMDFDVGSIALASGNSTVVASYFRVKTKDEYNGQFVIESRSADLRSRLWIRSRDHPILDISTSASGTLICTSIYREQGPTLILLDADTGFINKDTAVVSGNCNVNHKTDRCYQVKMGHDVERNSTNYTHTCEMLSHLSNRCYFNTVWSRLSCSKTNDSRLVALEKEGNRIHHQSLAAKKISSHASFARALSLIMTSVSLLLSAISIVLSFIVYAAVESICQRYLFVFVLNLHARLANNDHENEIMIPFLVGAGLNMFMQRYVLKRMQLDEDEWIADIRKFIKAVSDPTWQFSLRSSPFKNAVDFYQIIKWMICL